MKAWRLKPRSVAVWVLPLLPLALSTSVSGDPVQSEVAITLPQGTTTVRSFMRVTEFEGAGGSAWEVQNQIAHGLTAKTNLLLLAPVVGGTARRGAGGLGDVTLLVKQQVWKRNRLQTQERVALIGGVKLPTGETSEQDSTRGLPRGLQPGSGAWDFPVGVLFAHDAARGFFADALYTVRTGARGYHFGNILRYDLAYTQALAGGNPYENFTWAVLEMNGSVGARDRSRGQEVPASGGHVLFLSPGLRLVHWSGRYVLDLSYQIPLVTDLNGHQTEPRRSWLVGARLNF